MARARAQVAVRELVPGARKGIGKLRRLAVEKTVRGAGINIDFVYDVCLLQFAVQLFHLLTRNAFIVSAVQAQHGHAEESQTGDNHPNQCSQAHSHHGCKEGEPKAPEEVRKGYYYVLGDHRNSSNDSRNWGEVPERYIYGKAFLRFWPLTKAGPIH